jgi:hypothetical protein
MGPGPKIAITGVAAWYAGQYVGTTDWFKKQVADAIAKDSTAGVPLEARGAQALAAAAVAYAGYRFFVHKKEG